MGSATPPAWAKDDREELPEWHDAAEWVEAICEKHGLYHHRSELTTSGPTRTAGWTVVVADQGKRPFDQFSAVGYPSADQAAWRTLDILRVWFDDQCPACLGAQVLPHSAFVPGVSACDCRRTAA